MNDLVDRPSRMEEGPCIGPDGVGEAYGDYSVHGSRFNYPKRQLRKEELSEVPATTQNVNLEKKNSVKYPQLPKTST
jgi:hypothetical protein